MNETKKALSRNDLRAALIGQKHKAKSELVTLFGVEIEIRQPTLGAILDIRTEDDERTRTTDVFIRYAYVPGTDDKVFEDTDREAILNWPFNEEIMGIQTAIAKLTGVDLSDAVAEITADPLDESS